MEVGWRGGGETALDRMDGADCSSLGNQLLFVISILEEISALNRVVVLMSDDFYPLMFFFCFIS